MGEPRTWFGAAATNLFTFAAGHLLVVYQLVFHRRSSACLSLTRWQCTALISVLQWGRAHLLDKSSLIVCTLK